MISCTSNKCILTPQWMYWHYMQARLFKQIVSSARPLFLRVEWSLGSLRLLTLYSCTAPFHQHWILPFSSGSLITPPTSVLFLHYKIHIALKIRCSCLKLAKVQMNFTGEASISLIIWVQFWVLSINSDFVCENPSSCCCQSQGMGWLTGREA